MSNSNRNSLVSPFKWLKSIFRSPEIGSGGSSDLELAPCTPEREIDGKDSTLDDETYVIGCSDEDDGILLTSDDDDDIKFKSKKRCSQSLSEYSLKTKKARDDSKNNKEAATPEASCLPKLQQNSSDKLDVMPHATYSKAFEVDRAPDSSICMNLVAVSQDDDDDEDADEFSLPSLDESDCKPEVAKKPTVTAPMSVVKPSSVGSKERFIDKEPTTTSNAKQQDFYGNVQQTIAKLSQIIESMPLPDEHEKAVYKIGQVDLYDHQYYGVRWLSFREREFPYGGVLADEMGLGKTIMMIALIIHEKERTRTSDESWLDTDPTRNCIHSSSTLVICPVGCMPQWNNEILSKGSGLRVCIYHSSKRTTSASELAQYDVIITSYPTVASELPKDSLDSHRRSPLARIYWRRIVLDEAHTIRNPKTAAALAACQLRARHRWAVTGTPVHNKPADFYSIVKFLRMTPFDDKAVWNFWIGMKKVKKLDHDQQCLAIISKSIILRRTKEEVQNAGGNVKKIPEKSIRDVEVELTEGERKIYDYLSLFAKNVFAKFLEGRGKAAHELDKGVATYTTDGHKEKMKEKKESDPDMPTDIKIAHIFALLCRLRQCAVLPFLIHTMLQDEEIEEDVSFDELNDEHIVSKINPVFDRLYMSAKITKMLDDLEEIRQQGRNEGRSMDKVVIISSWTTTLDILYEHLRNRGFVSVFITGRENTQEREENMKRFNRTTSKYSICLLSLLAGGVGLNLMGGNHVFFMEPHWNPQMELQAQDRCHRFGQTKDVFVRRYISKDTVEQRVLDLQGSKLELADAVIQSAARKNGTGLSIKELKALFY